MKVTDVKTFVVDCFRTNWVFVKVYTDEGITGVGEGTLEYKEKALVGAIDHIKSYLIGKDPRQIEKHYHDIYRDAYWRGGAVLMSALSAVEMALWDILGKSLGVPVYQLLGGKVNEDCRIYVNGWFAGAKEPEEFGEKAKIAIERGVTAMKWDPFGKSYLQISNADLDKALRCIAAVREAVGNSVDLLIEGQYIRIEDAPCIGRQLRIEIGQTFLLGRSILFRLAIAIAEHKVTTAVDLTGSTLYQFPTGLGIQHGMDTNTECHDGDHQKYDQQNDPKHPIFIGQN